MTLLYDLELAFSPTLMSSQIPKVLITSFCAKLHGANLQKTWGILALILSVPNDFLALTLCLLCTFICLRPSYH